MEMKNINFVEGKITDRSRDFFDMKKAISEYPKDFIPSGTRTFIGFDYGKDEYECKGFYKDGVFHVQSFEKVNK